jgi:hypothetical protein
MGAELLYLGDQESHYSKIANRAVSISSGQTSEPSITSKLLDRERLITLARTISLNYP